MEDYFSHLKTKKFTVKILYVIATILVVTSPSASSTSPNTYNITSLPNPSKDSHGCGSNVHGYVCNPEKILAEHEVSRLNGIIKRMMDESKVSSKPCLEKGDGFIFSVAVIPEMTLSNDVGNGKKFANMLRENWKFGQCGNDGVLLLVTSESSIYIATGHFMRKLIKPICTRNIQQQTQHHMNANNWSELLSVTLLRFNVVLKHGCEIPDDTSSGTIVAAVVSSTLLGSGLVFFCCCKCHPNKGKGPSIQVAFIGKSSPSYGGADGYGEFTEVDGGRVVAQSPSTSKQTEIIA